MIVSGILLSNLDCWLFGRVIDIIVGGVVGEIVGGVVGEIVGGVVGEIVGGVVGEIVGGVVVTGCLGKFDVFFTNFVFI
jgi:uncharacterized membrane protein YeaQ/YmgE (transglycosylase-associated protein family)